MTPAAAQILEEAERLSAAERAELADRLVEGLADDIPPEIAQAQITEVRRRIAEVESGEVALIPGDEALAQIRRLVASAGAADKLLLVSELWDDLAAHPTEIPVSREKIAELDRRREAYRRDPSQVTTWEAIQQRILGKTFASSETHHS